MIHKGLMIPRVVICEVAILYMKWKGLVSLHPIFLTQVEKLTTTIGNQKKTTTKKRQKQVAI